REQEIEAGTFPPGRFAAQGRITCEFRDHPRANALGRDGVGQGRIHADPAIAIVDHFQGKPQLARGIRAVADQSAPTGDRAAAHAARVGAMDHRFLAGLETHVREEPLVAAQQGAWEQGGSESHRKGKDRSGLCVGSRPFTFAARGASKLWLLRRLEDMPHFNRINAPCWAPFSIGTVWSSTLRATMRKAGTAW